jgi:hypothetical protein
MLKSALGLDVTLLRQKFVAGNPVVDLTGTTVANRLSSLLAKLAIGNEGSAQVNKLEFNVGTLSFNAEVTIRHRHSWGSVGEILEAAGKRVGEWATKAGDTVRQATDSAGNFIRETINRDGTKLRQTWEAARRDVEEKWGGAQKYWKGVWSDATATANKMISRYVEQLDGQKVASQFANGVMTARQTWEKSGQYIEEKWGGAQKYWKGVWSDATATANKMISRFKQTWDGYWSAEYWGGAQDYWYGIWDSANKMRERLVIKGGQKVLDTWDAAGHYAQTVWDKGGHVISTIGQGVLGGLGGLLGLR